MHLFTKTFVVLAELFGDDEAILVKFDCDALLRATKRIRERGAVPIITAEELAWETDDPRPRPTKTCRAFGGTTGTLSDGRDQNPKA